MSPSSPHFRLSNRIVGGYVEGNNSFVRFYDNWDGLMFPWVGYGDDVQVMKWNIDKMDSLMVSLGGAYRSGLRTHALEEYRLVSKVSRAEFLKFIKGRRILRHVLEDKQKRLLRLARRAFAKR